MPRSTRTIGAVQGRPLVYSAMLLCCLQEMDLWGPKSLRRGPFPSPTHPLLLGRQRHTAQWGRSENPQHPSTSPPGTHWIRRSSVWPLMRRPTHPCEPTRREGGVAKLQCVPTGPRQEKRPATRQQWHARMSVHGFHQHKHRRNERRLMHSTQPTCTAPHQPSTVPEGCLHKTRTNASRRKDPLVHFSWVTRAPLFCRVKGPADALDAFCTGAASGHQRSQGPRAPGHARRHRQRAQYDPSAAALR